MKKSTKTKKALDASLRADLDSVLNESRSSLSKPARRYMESIVDPKRYRSKCPSLIGGVRGRTAVRHLVATVEVVVGTGGWGYAVLDPGSDTFESGPYSDRIIGSYTGIAYAGSGTSVLSGVIGSGVVSVNWANAQYEAASSSTASMNYCPVSYGMYITPTNSRLNQGGKIILYESSSHFTVGDTLSKIVGYPDSRIISGLATNDTICLNGHPQSGEYSAIEAGAFCFRANAGAQATIVPRGNLIAIFKGAVNSTFEVEFVCNYELRGSAVAGKTGAVADSRGMDLVFNTLCTKSLSGWHAKPHEAQAGYLTRLWHMGRKLATDAVRRKMKTMAHEGPVLALAEEVMGSL